MKTGHFKSPEQNIEGHPHCIRVIDLNLPSPLPHSKTPKFLKNSHDVNLRVLDTKLAICFSDPKGTFFLPQVTVVPWDMRMMMKTPFVTGRLYSDAFKLGLEVRGSSLDSNQQISNVYNMIY